MARNNKIGRIVVLKVRYADFSTLTKRKTLDDATNDFDIIEQAAYEIFDSLEESKLVCVFWGLLYGLEDNIRPLNLFKIKIPS